MHILLVSQPSIATSLDPKDFPVEQNSVTNHDRPLIKQSANDLWYRRSLVTSFIWANVTSDDALLLPPKYYENAQYLESWIICNKHCKSYPPSLVRSKIINGSEFRMILPSPHVEIKSLIGFERSRSHSHWSESILLGAETVYKQLLIQLGDNSSIPHAKWPCSCRYW